MNEKNLFNPDELIKFAFKCRNNILDLSTNGGCFIGSAYSCIDILSFIYLHYLDYRKIKNKDKDRDIFILSKGHAVSGLYALLAELDFFPKQKLEHYLSINDNLYWHPNTNIPGIEFHTGSMGHGLSLGIGMALASSLSGYSNKIVVLLGDGELNEGSIWESVLIANAYNLHNIVAIIDRNSLQANMKTENLIPLESLEKKFSSFGWDTYTCNGHDFVDIEKTFSKILVSDSNKPTMIIANTMRGKGISSLENNPKYWFGNFTLDQINKLKEELSVDLKKQN